MKRQLGVSLVSALLLSACAASEKEAEQLDTNHGFDVPEWVMVPSVLGGLAAASCVNASNNFNIDKRHAEAGARSALAQSINVKASVMDRSYSRLNRSESGTQTGETFETVAKSISDVRMQRSQITNVGMGKVNGQSQVCAMAVIDESLVASLFDDVVKQAGVPIDPQDEAAMYEEFRTQKAMSELEQELERLMQ